MSKHLNSWSWSLVALLGACVGGTQEPQNPTGDDGAIEPDIGLGYWCGATYEDVGLDDVVDGFDATPQEALASLEGAFQGQDEEVAVAVDLTLTLDPVVRVARVVQYELEEEVPEEAVLSNICSDHFAMSGSMDLGAEALLQLSMPVDIAYFDGEDTGDGFGWDLASFSLVTETWDGEAAPSWDPDEMEIIEMTMFARWSGGVREGGTDGGQGTDVPASIWSVELSFWGESAPGTGNDSAVWASEEWLMSTDLVPATSE